MRPEDPALPLPRIGRSTLVPALICAGLSVILIRAGFLTFFFLVPLGICAVVFGPGTAWLGFACAAVSNSVWSLGFLMRNGGLQNAGLNSLYFAVLALGFTWIMAGASGPPVRTLYRFMAASAAGALALLVMTYSMGSDAGFSDLLRSRLEAVTSSYIASSGADAAQRAFLERLLTPDKIIDIFSMVILRGGALVSAVFLFFFSRQTVFVIARLFRRAGKNVGNDLIGFYAPRKTIWILTMSLPVILFCRMVSLEMIEIAAWNLLVLCVIMFLAQGGGVILYNLAYRPMPVIIRLLSGFLIIFLILSPGINVAVLGLFVLLGITENWVPLRKKMEI